jgi:nucleoside-diphosphate-sugar epimerase
MQIVGSGLIARGFERFRDDFPDALLYASGVSRSTGAGQPEFQREADLLYAALRKCRADGRRIVYFSTASVHLYGRSESLGEEDRPIEPCTAYGRHKAAMEMVIRMSGADHLILRLSEVVGAGQRGHQLLPSLAGQVAEGRVTVYRGAWRDIIDVDDVASIAAELLAAGITRETLNVASGHSVSAEDIVDHLARLSARAIERDYVDTPADRCRISTAKLSRSLPAGSVDRFSPTYYRSVIEKYYRSDGRPARGGAGGP